MASRRMASWVRPTRLGRAVGSLIRRRARAESGERWRPMPHRATSEARHCCGLLAELEAVTRGPDSALASVDEGLAIAADTAERLTDPYLHRLRGDVLLKRDPANVA